MTCTIRPEPGQHRIRLAGECEESDREPVVQALDEMADEAATVILDLTAVPTLHPAVAEAIVDVRQRHANHRMSVMRRCGTQVDEVLSQYHL